MADATVTLKFRWIQVSPDSHLVSMRNTLEPIDVVVSVEIPLKHEYIANSEEIIKTKVGVDGVKEDTPVLTKEGLQYAIDALTLSEDDLEPITEEDFDSEDADWEDLIDTDDDDEDIDWEE
jgi:hypothetical protein